MGILTKDFKFIDLFSGIGGFHYAMNKYSNDAKCIFASEINSNAIKLYKINHKMDSDFDITKVKGKDMGKFDVLCAGFPCQSFSKAGQQLGFEDSRGVLFNEIERLIKEKIELAQKPKILILENVKNLVTHDNHRTWQTIKNKLRNIGYNVIDKPLVFSPHDFDIPQLRERAIILAVDDNIYSGEIKFDIPKKQTTKTIYDILQSKEEFEYTKFKISKIEKKALDAWDYFIKHLNRKVIGFPIWSDDFYNDRDTSALPEWKKDFIQKNKQLYSENKVMIDKWYIKYDIKEFLPTHRKFEWQAGNDINSVYEGLIQFRPSGIRVKRPNSIPTLVAMKHVPIIGKEKRYITPLEAAKLQSLPENFDFDSVGKDIYRLLGNAVNVDVIYNVFLNFINFLDQKVGNGHEN